MGNHHRGLGSARHAGPDRAFLWRRSERAEIGAGRFIFWLNITASEFYDSRERYGKVNEHNGVSKRKCPESSGQQIVAIT